MGVVSEATAKQIDGEGRGRVVGHGECRAYYTVSIGLWQKPWRMSPPPDIQSPSRSRPVSPHGGPGRGGEEGAFDPQNRYDQASGVALIHGDYSIATEKDGNGSRTMPAFSHNLQGEQSSEIARQHPTRCRQGLNCETRGPRRCRSRVRPSVGQTFAKRTDVPILGFGRYSGKNSSVFVDRNPRTDGRIIMKPSAGVSFKSGKPPQAPLN